MLFAKALGCEVYAFSHSSNKEQDCKKLGVDYYVLDSPGFQDQHKLKLDILLSTRDTAHGFPLTEYLS